MAGGFVKRAKDEKVAVSSHIRRQHDSTPHELRTSRSRETSAMQDRQNSAGLARRESSSQPSRQNSAATPGLARRESSSQPSRQSSATVPGLSRRESSSQPSRQNSAAAPAKQVTAVFKLEKLGLALNEGNFHSQLTFCSLTVS